MMPLDAELELDPSPLRGLMKQIEVDVETAFLPPRGDAEGTPIWKTGLRPVVHLTDLRTPTPWTAGLTSYPWTPFYPPSGY